MHELQDPFVNLKKVYLSGILSERGNSLEKSGALRKNYKTIQSSPGKKQQLIYMSKNIKESRPKFAEMNIPGKSICKGLRDTKIRSKCSQAKRQADKKAI